MQEITGPLIPLTYVVFSILEKVAPARAQPSVACWRAKGFVSFLVVGAIMTLVPMGVARLAGGAHLVDFALLPVALAIAVAMLATNLVGYWAHRLRHGFTPLWRVHQMHHSAERMDVPGAFYFHPLDVLFPATISSGVVVALGLGADQAALLGYLGFTITAFTHLNVRTPRWLGFFIQRPESHSIHHERGVHAFNYADLPIVDMIFGTFRNPAGFSAPTGFWDGASAHTVGLLTLQDVSEDPTGTSADRAPALAS